MDQSQRSRDSDSNESVTRRRFLQDSTTALAGVALLPQLATAEQHPADPAQPDIKSLHWNKAEIVAQNAKRSRISLDGLWRFTPIADRNRAPLKPAWAYIKVPGNWGTLRDDAASSDVVFAGNRTAWGSRGGAQISRAWYERRVPVPAEWKGRIVSLRLERVSTDAMVFVNGIECGRVSWPWGAVDVTRAVEPGKTAGIRVLVAAIPDSQMVGHFWQNAFMAVTYSAAKLKTRGLTGSVYLESRSSEACVDDVFVRTSTRKKQIALEVSLSGVQQAGRVHFVADLLNERGVQETRFTGDTAVAGKPAQAITLLWPWANPRLWDVDQPNLYTLRLTVTGAGVDDQYNQEFGFREFWIEGTEFYLNGTVIHLRQPCFYRGPLGLVGDNFAEMGPGNPDARGNDSDASPDLDRADRKGYLAAVYILDANKYMRDQHGKFVWRQNRFRAMDRAALWIRHYRNHPSAVMWIAGRNFFNDAVDLDPRHLGRHGWAKTNRQWRQLMGGAAEMFAALKRLDPTRVYYSHEGSDTGDVHSANCYLDLLPLQEREEWLSAWAKNGQMPVSMSEFGTPMDCTFRRGHDGFSTNITSEPLLTEYAAIYFGPDAYASEGPEYRQFLHDMFLGGMLYKSTQDRLDPFENMHKIQELFRIRTWRSWRTAGLSGGLRTWSNLQDELKKVNFPTLAWIAGEPGTYVAKDHHFRAGEKFKKQIVLINDARRSQDFKAVWTASAGGTTVAEGELRGNLPISEIRKIPIEIDAPHLEGGGKLDGQITLDANIGEAVHHDKFSFRTYGDLGTASGRLGVLDPGGLTRNMLGKLGYTLRDWNGKAEPLVVIGRDGLKDDPAVAVRLESYVGNGGRALIFAQNPEWMVQALGWRVCPKVSRRVFPVPNSPVTRGSDANDLRDWTASSTLIPAFPEYVGNYLRGNEGGQPYAGWHWGNRGGVSSAAIEKPHRSAFTPLLECEFDMAYTPLMQLNYGRGRLMICTLDLEDHAAMDPAAQLLAKSVVDYALDATLEPRARVVLYLGNGSGADWLDRTGVSFERSNALSANADLVLIGPEATVNTAVLNSCLNRGGKVFFLPQSQARGWLGATLKLAKPGFAGSLSAPGWPEAAGLSASDLRWRTHLDVPPRILGDGMEIGADGLLGRKIVGNGVAIFCQVDPDRFNAEEKTYLHYTRWRSTRAVAQILANLGASFPVDRRIFHPLDTWSANLDGLWRMKVTLALPPVGNSALAHRDPGITQGARSLVGDAVSTEGWTPLTMPQMAPFFDRHDGEAVFRREIVVPSQQAGHDMILELGELAGFDDTYFNGERVGHTGMETANWRHHLRAYPVPGKLVRAGANAIAVRLFNCFGPGGFAGMPGLPVGPDGDRSGHDSTGPRIGLEMSLKPAPEGAQSLDWYCSDYRTDFPMGDNPYRYYRW